MRIKWEEVFGGLKEGWSKRELRCAEGRKYGENQKNTKVLQFRDISGRGAARRKIRYSRAKIEAETVKYFDKIRRSARSAAASARRRFLSVSRRVAAEAKRTLDCAICTNEFAISADEVIFFTFFRC